MTSQPTNLASYRRGQLPTPLGPAPFGWADHRTRTVALNAWLAREEAVAAGAAAPVDPAVLGLPDREALVRALFQRFTTTLEGVLDNELELGEDAAGEGAAYAAVRAAYRKAAAHRPASRRALQREAGDPVVVELTGRQHARIASRAGVSSAQVAAVAAELALVETLAPRARRRRTPRVLARRAG